MGGIFYEDVLESLPKCEKIVRNLHDEKKIIIVKRPADKKEVLFYFDHTSDFRVDDEFVKLWRSVAVDSLDDDKIDEYLDKQGENLAISIFYWTRTGKLDVTSFSQASNPCRTWGSGGRRPSISGRRAGESGSRVARRTTTISRTCSRTTRKCQLRRGTSRSGLSASRFVFAKDAE